MKASLLCTLICLFSLNCNALILEMHDLKGVDVTSSMLNCQAQEDNRARITFPGYDLKFEIASENCLQILEKTKRCKSVRLDFLLIQNGDRNWSVSVSAENIQKAQSEKAECDFPMM